MITVLLVVIILIFLIVVHELGHFVAAKMFGVKVEEFGVGYPPRAFLIGTWGGTEYTINWIPFGGFVRLFGEDPDKAARGRGSLVDSPRWKQAIILVAGVTMNALAAWFLMTGAYMLGVAHPVAQTGPDTRLIVTDVIDISPAAAAGLRAGDIVVSLSDEDGATLSNPTPQSVLDFVQLRGGEEIVVTFLRGGVSATALLRPAHAVIAEQSGRPAIGIGLALVTSTALPLREAAGEALYQTRATFRVVTAGLGQIIGDALRGRPDLEEVVGPIGLVSVVGEAADSGWGYVLALASFISVNLVIINLIPVPALDGGRLAIVAIASLMRRSAPRLALQSLNALGIALIAILMITVTYQDIARLIP